MAAKISKTECCLTNATEIQTKKQKTVIIVLQITEAEVSLSQVEAIPIEYAT